MYLMSNRLLLDQINENVRFPNACYDNMRSYQKRSNFFIWKIFLKNNLCLIFHKSNNNIRFSIASAYGWY